MNATIVILERDNSTFAGACVLSEVEIKTINSSQISFYLPEDMDTSDVWVTLIEAKATLSTIGKRHFVCLPYGKNVKVIYE